MSSAFGLAALCVLLAAACVPEPPATAEAPPAVARDPLSAGQIAAIDADSWSGAIRVYRVVDSEAGIVLYVARHGSDSVTMSGFKIADTELGPKWVKPAGSGTWEQKP